MAEEKAKPMDTVTEVVVVAEPVVNDSSAGLARMYADLKPYAARVRLSATMLMFFSLCLIGSLEGIFGLVAAVGVLCCAAPGSLGIAYAARCTRITASIAMVFALMHFFAIMSFAHYVLPHMPEEVSKMCHEEAKLTGEHQDLAAGQPAHFHVLAKVMFDPSAPMVESGAADQAVIAPTVATVAHKAGRMLEQVFVAGPAAPLDEHCAKVTSFFAHVAPACLFTISLFELGLFLSAFSTCTAAARLVGAARRMGANGL